MKNTSLALSRLVYGSATTAYITYYVCCGATFAGLPGASWTVYRLSSMLLFAWSIQHIVHS